MNATTEHYQHIVSNKSNEVEQHCHQLIIQMNALLKSLSAETLKFKQEDCEKLRQAAVVKYNELSKF